MERPLGVAVLGLIAGQVPDDEGLVAGAGEEHVRAAIIAVSTTSRRGNWEVFVAYFSIDVAKLVTQPFCRKNHQFLLVFNFGPAAAFGIVILIRRRAGCNQSVREENLRGPPGCP